MKDKKQINSLPKNDFEVRHERIFGSRHVLA